MFDSSSKKQTIAGPGHRSDGGKREHNQNAWHAAPLPLWTIWVCGAQRDSAANNNIIGSNVLHPLTWFTKCQVVHSDSDSYTCPQASQKIMCCSCGETCTRTRIFGLCNVTTSAQEAGRVCRIEMETKVRNNFFSHLRIYNQLRQHHFSIVS